MCFCTKKVPINQNWEFSKTQDTTNWEKIQIPHTCNDKNVIDEIPDYYRGIGWYKKDLNVSAKKMKRLTFISMVQTTIQNCL